MTGNEPVVDIVMRRRRANDLESLVELDLASARHHATIDPESCLVAERDAVGRFLESRLRDPDRQVIVAEVDGEVVGAVDITLVAPRDPGSIVRATPTADLGISVAEGWRVAGSGTRSCSPPKATPSSEVRGG
jgi:hypothetical protein